jgi:hypothetical protein
MLAIYGLRSHCTSSFNELGARIYKSERGKEVVFVDSQIIMLLKTLSERRDMEIEHIE